MVEAPALSVRQAKIGQVLQRVQMRVAVVSLVNYCILLEFPPIFPQESFRFPLSSAFPKTRNPSSLTKLARAVP